MLVVNNRAVFENLENARTAKIPESQMPEKCLALENDRIRIWQ